MPHPLHTPPPGDPPTLLGVVICLAALFLMAKCIAEALP
jgi:hypothetical protein